MLHGAALGKTNGEITQWDVSKAKYILNEISQGNFLSPTEI